MVQCLRLCAIARKFRRSVIDIEGGHVAPRFGNELDVFVTGLSSPRDFKTGIYELRLIERIINSSSATSTNVQTLTL
jgi:hypothetical protein